MADPPQDAAMTLTGERTAPGIAHENYWFRRHEAVYELAAEAVSGRVLEAGCGEGYGAALLRRVATGAHALDYDDLAVRRVQRTYPKVSVVRGNLVALPYADRSFDAVVSLQTIEHLWDQTAFVAECVRVLRPGGSLVLSTPNVMTFPPGNLYHRHELTAAELVDVVRAHAHLRRLDGVRHRPRIASYETRHGSVVHSQLAQAPQDWDPGLRALVESVRTADFAVDAGSVETCLDLVVVATR